MGVHDFHDNTMSVEVYGFGHWVSMFVENLNNQSTKPSVLHFTVCSRPEHGTLTKKNLNSSFTLIKPFHMSYQDWNIPLRN